MKTFPTFLPTQVATWLPQNFNGAGEPDIDEGEWLRCLKDTGPDERLVVWEGAAGRGVVAVVDFAAQRRTPARGSYEGWGRIQQLDPAIGPDALSREPLLADRFLGPRARGLQGSPNRLSVEEGEAIARVATRLPSQALPVDEPTYDEEIIFWAGDLKGPPEAILEHDIHTTRRMWKALGFPSAPLKQRCLPTLHVGDDPRRNKVRASSALPRRTRCDQAHGGAVAGAACAPPRGPRQSHARAHRLGVGTERGLGSR